MHTFERQFRFFSIFAFLFAPMFLAVDGGDGGGGGGGDGGAGAGQGGDGEAGDGSGGDGGAGAGAGDAGKGAAGDGKGTLLGKGAPAAGKGAAGAGDGKGGQGDGKGGAPGTGAGDPFFVNLWDKTGKIDKKAFDRLPDGLKAHKDLFAKYDTAEAFFHGVANLGQLAGKKGLQPLPDGAPAEVVAERNALMRQLNGVPEKPEGYGLAKPADMPDEQWNGEYVTGIAGILHKHNVSPACAKELAAYDIAAAQKMREGYGAQGEAALQKEAGALKEAFGEGDAFSGKINMAQRAARTLGLDINDPTIGNNSRIIIALAKVAEMVSEDRLVSGDGKGGDSMTDRQKAIDIVKNESNPLHKAYHDPNDPRHDEAVAAHSTFNKRHLERTKTKK